MVQCLVSQLCKSVAVACACNVTREWACVEELKTRMWGMFGLKEHGDVGMFGIKTTWVWLVFSSRHEEVSWFVCRIIGTWHVWDSSAHA